MTPGPVPFRVPERARITDHADLGTTARAGNNGAFDIESIAPGWRLILICSDGGGWEHVSCHAYRPRGRRHQTRTPSWDEMCFVRDLCWGDDQTVVQFHPPRADYVNTHPNTLHLWRPVNVEIPRPPRIFV